MLALYTKNNIARDSHGSHIVTDMCRGCVGKGDLMSIKLSIFCTSVSTGSGQTFDMYCLIDRKMQSHTLKCLLLRIGYHDLFSTT